jgi:surface antigen
MPVDSLPRRLSFLCLSMLAVVNLSLMVYIMAAPKNHNMTIAQLISIPSSVQTVPGRTFSDIGDVIGSPTQTISRTSGEIFRGIRNFPDHVVHLTRRALDIYTYIRPADYTDIPKIVPMPAVKTIATVAPVPTAAITTASPAVSQKHDATYRSGSADSSNTGSVSLASADMYAWGNCTRWAAVRRAEVGDPIPGNWGNAATWAERAAADGYTVDQQPTPGAIMQTADSAGGLGHVAFVESVDSDGTWHISEMNVLGLDVIDHRTMPLSAAADYNFIHDR